MTTTKEQMRETVKASLNSMKSLIEEEIESLRQELIEVSSEYGQKILEKEEELQKVLDTIEGMNILESKVEQHKESMKGTTGKVQSPEPPKPQESPKKTFPDSPPCPNPKCKNSNPRRGGSTKTGKKRYQCRSCNKWYMDEEDYTNVLPYRTKPIIPPPKMGKAEMVEINGVRIEMRFYSLVKREIVDNFKTIKQISRRIKKYFNLKENTLNTYIQHCMRHERENNSRFEEKVVSKKGEKAYRIIPVRPTTSDKEIEEYIENERKRRNKLSKRR